MSALVKLRLYVAGDGPNSLLAIANLNAICREHLPDQYHVQLVDVLLDPQRALADGVFLTPTLVKLSPGPIRKIVGTLSQAVPVLLALGLPVPTA
ncbi:MAG: circadian clock KaiB family protein [Gemmatimonadota bacterium]